MAQSPLFLCSESLCLINQINLISLGFVYHHWECVPELWVLFILMSLGSVYCVPWDYVPKLWVLCTLVSLGTVGRGTISLTVG